MKVLVDGKEIQVQNDVKVIYDEVIYGMDDNDQDLEGELHVTLNCEGIVADVIDEVDGDFIGTMCNTYGEMAEWCI